MCLIQLFDSLVLSTEPSMEFTNGMIGQAVVGPPLFCSGKVGFVGEQMECRDFAVCSREWWDVGFVKLLYRFANDWAINVVLNKVTAAMRGFGVSLLEPVRQPVAQ